MIRSTAWLRPIHTPITTARIITTTVATRVAVSVIIALFHSSSQRSVARQMTAAMPAFQPPRIIAIARIARAVMNHGDSASTYCSGLMTEEVNPSARAVVAPDQFVEIQSTASCTPFAIRMPRLDSQGFAAKT